MSLSPQQQGHNVATSRSVRRHLLSLAYGYLGSLSEGEDLVQEALLRFEQADQGSIQNAEAWLTTVVSRLAIDKIRSAQHRREVYPGEWLPEPVFQATSQEQDAITRSRLSIGLLYLLERLEPDQRVVFILREVFEHSYRSIAKVAGKSEAACRQLMVRARASLGRVKPVPSSAEIASSVIDRFLEALAQGDEEELLKIIAPDAVLIGDGGGKVPSILNPVYGADRIVRFFLGIQHKLGHILRTEIAPVNSGPGMLTFHDDELFSVASVSIENDCITAIYSVSNPDKIRAGHFRRM